MPVGTLAPNIKYYVNNNCGVAAIGGTINTFDAITGFPKATYSDAALQTPNPTSISVGGDGAADTRVYWATGLGENLYTVETRDASGALIERFPNYPIITDTLAGGGATPITVTTNYPNYACNEQFGFWSRGTSFDNTTLPIGTTQIADTWFFTRSNIDATLSISKYDFPAGASTARSNPTSAFRYTVTVPSADGENDISQILGDVQTLSDSQIAIAFEMQTLSAGSTATFTLFIEQFFGGGGGSPTVTTAVGTLNVTDAMQIFTFNIAVPTISGQAIGTDGDDYFKYFLRGNPAQIQDVIGTNSQVQESPGTGINYPYIVPKEQQAKILNNQLLGPDADIGASLVGYTDTETVRDALDNIPEKNFLIGWDFRKNPRQLGTTNTSSTFALNSNNTILMDQTILLSDGDNVVTIDQGVQDACRMTVVSPATKFGIFQKITAEDSQSIIYNAKCSLRVALSMTSASSNMRIAVVGIAGTADQQGTDIVASWNGENIPPTLSAGWYYLQNPDLLTSGQATGALPDFTDVFFQNLTVPSGTVNIGVFIWSDTVNLVASDQVEVLYAQLNLGVSAAPIQELSESETLALCQQFIFKTYEGSNTPLSAFSNENSPNIDDPVWSFDQTGISGPFSLLLRTISYSYTFPVTMFKGSPSRIATVYNPFTSAINSARTTGTYNAGGGDVAFTEDLGVTITNVSEQYISFKKSSSGSIETDAGFPIIDSDSPCYFQLIVFSNVG